MEEGKQVVEYSSISTRMMAAALDLFILIIIMAPVMNYVSFLMFEGRTIDVILGEIEAQNPGGVPVSMSDILSKLSAEGFFMKYFTVQLCALSMMTLYTFFFWIKMSATPGKLIVGCRVVDYKTLEKPSIAQYIGRFLGYVLSALPVTIGFLMAMFTKDSRALHDKLAGTAVIRVKHDFGLIKRFRSKVSG